MFATAAGTVRRNALSDFTNINKAGKRAMRLEEDDLLVGVTPCTDEDDVFLATRDGKAIRFNVSDVRVFKGRDSLGVRGVRLLKDDRVVSMSILRRFDIDGAAGGAVDATDMIRRQEILTVTTRGFGKRTPIEQYRVTGRGGQGVSNVDLTQKNGLVAASFPIAEQDQIMLVTDNGQVIRTPVIDVRVAARSTQGVYIFRVADDEKVVSVSLVGETGSEDGDEAGDEPGDEPESADGVAEAPDTNTVDGSDTSDGEPTAD